MTQALKGWDAYLMASMFQKEASFAAGKTHTNSTSCSFKGFDFDPGHADVVTNDKDEVNGKEHGYDQEITAYLNNPSLKFARVRPNDLAAFAALILGSPTASQDAALTAYRHRIVPITDGSALPSISIVHKIGGIQTEYKGAKGNTLKLAGEAGGFLSMDVGMIASGNRASNAAAFAAAITESWMKIDQLKFFLETGANIAIGTGCAFDGTPTTLTFVDGAGGADTLTDSASGFVADGFKPGMTVVIANATTPANNGSYALVSVAAGTLTFATGSWSVGEIGSATLTVVGTPTQATEDISSATPDDFSIRGKSFEFGWDNKAEGQPGFGGATYLQDVIYGRRSATFRATIQFASDAEIAYFTAQDVCAIELDFKAAGLIAVGGSMYYGAQIVIPRAKIKAYPQPKGGVGDSLSQDFDFEIFEDGTNPAVIFDVFCAQAAYLAAP
ncbi:MAG: hypothetical protein ABIJ57_01300 [Pseudomonadota bacterium]